MIYSICLIDKNNKRPIRHEGFGYTYIHGDNSELIKATYGKYPSQWNGLSASSFLPLIERAKEYLDATILLDATKLAPYCGKPWSDPNAVLDSFKRLIEMCRLYPDAVVEVDS